MRKLKSKKRFSVWMKSLSVLAVFSCWWTVSGFAKEEKPIPVMAFHFDEGKGDIFSDEISGTAFKVSALGGEWTKGKEGTALFVKEPYATMAIDQDLPCGSVSIWVKPGFDSSEQKTGKEIVWLGTEDGEQLDIAVGYSGTPFRYMKWRGKDGAHQISESGTTFKKDVWQNLVGTWEKTQDGGLRMEFYINKELVGNLKLSKESVQSTHFTRLLIGVNFLGAVDELMVYNRNIMATASGREELLLNPGFEGTYLNGITRHWNNNCYGDNKAVFSEETENVHSGNACQKIQCISYVNGGVQFHSQGFSVDKDKNYVVKVWMRGKALNGPVTVAIRKFATPYTHYLYKTVEVTEEWNEYTFSGPSPDSCEMCGLFIFHTSTGVLWIDDATVKKVKEEIEKKEGGNK